MTPDSIAKIKLDDFLGNEFIKLVGNDIPPSFFHYTTAAGMQAIVKSGLLRAYNLARLNDLAEARYAASVMRAHIDRSYAIEANDEIAELLSEMRKQASSFSLSNVFSLSFTTNGDEQGMWRLYSDRGQGFSFAIPSHDALLWAREKHQGMLWKCCYDSNVLYDFCLRSIAKIREIYSNAIKAGLKPNAAEYAAVFLENISWFAPAFKPEAWREEKEWRFIFRRSSPDHKVLPDGSTFIELPLIIPSSQDPRPISSICAGPDCDYQDNIVHLQKTMHENGYEEKFPVHTSIKHLARLGRISPIFRQKIEA